MRRTLALILALHSAALPALADTVTVTARRAGIQTYPAATAPVMSAVSEGTQLQVERREGEWFRVRPLEDAPGSPRTGYLHSSLVRLNPAGAGDAKSSTGAIAIGHKGVSCLAADVYSRLEACFDPASEVSRARLQFRATGHELWYFVEMTPDGACHRATLPRPLASTAGVEYYIETANRSLAETRTAEFRARVVPTRADCGGLVTPPALGTATVTVGTTAVGAPAVPAGFNVSGVVARAVVAPPVAAPSAPVAPPPVAPAGPAIPPEPSGGFSTRLLLGAAALAAGGAGVYLATRGEDPAQIDDDGDGVTEEQGDCNDRDQDIKPDGGFDLRIEFAYPSGGSVNCGTRNLAQQTYRVTNNSCATLVIQGLTYNQTVAAPCTGTGSGSLALGANSVPSGATVTIRQGAAPGLVAPICCPSYPCSQAPCMFNIEYTVTTSAGAKTLSSGYTVTDSTGTDCPQCGTIGTDELFTGAPRATTPGGN
jgi:hypothetical protein